MYSFRNFLSSGNINIYRTTYRGLIVKLYYKGTNKTVITNVYGKHIHTAYKTHLLQSQWQYVIDNKLKKYPNCREDFK